MGILGDYYNSYSGRLPGITPENYATRVAMPNIIGGRPSTSPQWQANLNEQQLAQVKHARDYENRHSGAHIAGHNQFILIAKLAKLLDEADAQASKFKKIEELVNPAK